VLLHRLWVSAEVYEPLEQQPEDDAGSGPIKNTEEKRKAKLKRRVPVTALIGWPSFHLRDGTEVDNQLAAPAETRTPNLHRANQSLLEECGWKGGDSGDSAKRKNFVQRRNHKTYLTPTGLLMEGVYTN
jgi:hypothetical protein